MGTSFPVYLKKKEFANCFDASVPIKNLPLTQDFAFVTLTPLILTPTSGLNSLRHVSVYHWTLACIIGIRSLAMLTKRLDVLSASVITITYWE